MADIDLNSALSDLRDLAEHSNQRSQTAMLAALIDPIEAAMARGVPRTEILERLQRNGFTMNMRSFDSALYRIRQRLGKLPSRRAPSTLPTQPSSPTPSPMRATNPQHEPASTTSNPTVKSMEQIASENPEIGKKALLDLYSRQFTGAPQNSVAQKFGTR
ncbi:hypothetical protein [Paraburkholderia susongensis]|uniref:Uncharacterized protein n=1 Tax=Paraburkholderia susongensis TaxID=1515439 RepID=A0A1X7M6B6_9BURK|nr:hypothetical protein [Paraburkholderia susongensis]SMG61591.1 hypothetical protein SAMN06265784_12345 [Paraburkholderia susongensis]